MANRGNHNKPVVSEQRHSANIFIGHKLKGDLIIMTGRKNFHAITGKNGFMVVLSCLLGVSSAGAQGLAFWHRHRTFAFECRRRSKPAH